MKSVLRVPLMLAILLFLFLTSCGEKEVVKSLPRSTPEAEGVSSKDIITFLDSVAVRRHEFHSFMFLRHGKVIAEGWWDPYTSELKHTLYSASKSFTSTAVGLLVKEKKLSVDDKLISFWPEYLPDSISPYLEQLKIKDMLSMSTGQRGESQNTGENWVKSYLETPFTSEPGTKYRYSSMASFMLSATVQQITGEKVIDYLTPRLFEPLGIEGADWETNPEGINTGGWGLRLKTEDLAKFGQLYLQKGKWNGKQILTEEWVAEATSLKIQQNPNITQEKRDSLNDSMQGYCWQFWRAKNNSYQVNGYGGQFVLIIPDKDAVVVFTAESPDMWGELGMVWEFLYPAMKEDALPEDLSANDELKQRVEALSIPAPAATTNESVTSLISGKEITLAENVKNMKGITLQFNGDVCQMNLKAETQSYDFTFGSGKWQLGETTKHGPSIFDRAADNLNGLPPFKVAASYTWTDEQTLVLTLRYIENVHHEKITIHFDDIKNSKVSVDFRSTSAGNRVTTVEGILQNI